MKRKAVLTPPRPRLSVASHRPRRPWKHGGRSRIALAEERKQRKEGGAPIDAFLGVDFLGVHRLERLGERLDAERLARARDRLRLERDVLEPERAARG